ncbi:methyltransferase [Bradyrhizobium sp. RD5-C2]|uniref:class I SAM-dependent methyltransferase n=1 Tax=Bradyrhizobium sp. RD5-C2 TaxID=244562 RepID=UPI001CC55153
MPRVHLGRTEAPELLSAAKVDDRCGIVGGDVFESVPVGGDAYVIKSVLMDESDDSVVSILRRCRSVMLALQFVPTPELAIREMRRVTRPGGVVAAATWDTRGGFVAYRMIVDAAAPLDGKGREFRARSYRAPMSRPGELVRAWNEQGLRDVTEDMLTIRMEYSCFEEFWAPCEGDDGPIAAYVGTLDLGAKARLRVVVRSAYLMGKPTVSVRSPRRRGPSEVSFLRNYHSLQRVGRLWRRAATGLPVSTRPRLDQIKAAGAENGEGTEAILGQEPMIFPFGPFSSTQTAQHV